MNRLIEYKSSVVLRVCSVYLRVIFFVTQRITEKAQRFTEGKNNKIDKLSGTPCLLSVSPCDFFVTQRTTEGKIN